MSDVPPSPWRQQQPDYGQSQSPEQQQPQQPQQPAYPPPPEPTGYSYQGGPGYQAGPAPGQPAEWWKRALAIIIDIIILGIVSGIITGILGVSAFDASDTDPITGDVAFDFGAFGASSVISLVIGLLYSGLLEGSTGGQSVGKMALGIQVRDADSGGPIGFGKAVLRRLVYNLLFYALVIPGIINVLSPLWDARKQAWHDKAVNSLVVNKSA